MAYQLHIERLDPAGRKIPISLEEWRSAVATIPDLRLADGPITARNPVTGAVITIPNAGGDVEVSLPGKGWVRALHWSRQGTASFKAADDASGPVHRKAVELARKLNAVVRGDEGELYD